MARELATALAPRKVAVIDDYVQVISDRSDVAFSHYATYLGNMQVAIGRWEMERKAEKDKPDVTITCGTLLETSVYTAIYALSNDRTLFDPVDKQANNMRADMTMQYLGLLRADTVRYDLLYRLPVQSDDPWDTQVDEHLAEAAEAFSMPYTDLTADVDDSLKTILEEIETLETAASDESSSGDSTTEVEVN